MKYRPFIRSNLSKCIALIASTSLPTVAYSQELVDEEVVVTGIRSSLINAADIKRQQDGVVDAITAEDIGKFPDGNLAESLQRITGVSIDRQNNEGNQITVRGLGPNFNLVTLNGRQMPAASSPEQESIASATQSRAFNFAEIASESVTAVEVFKTARPEVPTGGIGATVNIKTARPFDFDDTKFVFSAAAVNDQSVEAGDDITPELGGLFSYSTPGKGFGVLANFSFSERHFSEISTHTDGWLRDQPREPLATQDGPYEFFCNSPGSNCNVGPNGSPAPFVYRPVSNISEIQNFERRRTNGQLVFQFAPVEEFVITADYVLSRFERDQERFGTGLFGVVGPDTSGTRLSENFSVLEVTRSNAAADALVYDNELVVENDSFGLNIDWQISDSFNLALDVHSSTSQSQPDGELNDNLAILQGPLGINHTLNYTPNGVNITTDDSGAFRGTCQFGRNSGLINEDDPSLGECTNRAGVDGFQDPDGFSPLGSVIRNIAIENQVDQFQFEANWDLDVVKLIAGISFTDYQVETLATSTGFFFQGLGDCPTCSDDLTQINIDAPSAFDTAVTFDVNQILQDNFPTQIPDIVALNPPTFFDSSEESLATYFAFATEFDIGLPAKLSGGFRYEETDVTGTAFQTFPLALQVVSATEGVVLFDPDTPEVFINEESGYDVFLPSLDFSITPIDDILLRFSYGRSIARPDLNALRPITTVSDFRPGTRSASAGNPDLLPYLSDNFDLSFEWYYSEGSYFSAAYFFKQVDDYITTQVTQETLPDLNGEPLRDPSGRFVVPAPDEDAIPVASEPTDPIAIFDVTRLNNSQEREVNGLELAVQHLFGTSGFGFQANYTVVESDAEYDVNNFDTQGILLGLSDTANLVGFYENDVFSVRIAANYREEFLLSENQLRATNEPVFVDEFLQVDLSTALNITENLALSFEVLNLFGEDQRQRGRFQEQFLFENDQDPRFTFGIRGNF